MFRTATGEGDIILTILLGLDRDVRVITLYCIPNTDASDYNRVIYCIDYDFRSLYEMTNRRP